MTVAESLDAALLRSRLGAVRKDRSVKALYGDKSWAQDLDIVNELGGHTGCVNALRYGSTTSLSGDALC